MKNLISSLVYNIFSMQICYHCTLASFISWPWIGNWQFNFMEYSILVKTRGSQIVYRFLKYNNLENLFNINIHNCSYRRCIVNLLIFSVPNYVHIHRNHIIGVWLIIIKVITLHKTQMIFRLILQKLILFP